MTRTVLIVILLIAAFAAAVAAVRRGSAISVAEWDADPIGPDDLAG
ncbi:hypothetical protein [Rhodococcus chondri]|uniref:Uncharacterized protein n=1 Tax=Rhodococcus chondri TaxID=3065941 RepID=A0ABU7JRN6_9NOCA|nr:hypothetical protein [Rhodococcus sp. CC-R104]MEE2032690.1 hypothetical protein [Rhodococcus sp. CC-R104]